MRIPKQFQLYGQTITVRTDDQLTHRQESTGEAHYRFNEIVLQSEAGYAGRPKTKVEQTFAHELMHYILYYGECSETKDLYKNEIVVDRLSNLLHQALSTMEYEEP